MLRLTHIMNKGGSSWPLVRMKRCATCATKQELTNPDGHACRGIDAGFVHLSCLAEYAAARSEQTSDMNEFIKPWESCPGCHQSYQNELRIDIATDFVSRLFEGSIQTIQKWRLST